jgi:endonuclease III related protein
MTSRPEITLMRYYEKMKKRFGHRGWWPGKSKIEIIAGAILTQNTSWSNVTRALDNLKQEKMLSVKGFRSLEEGQLAQLIRPSGYFNQKAHHLKEFISFLDREFGGSLACMSRMEMSPLRMKLLAVRGIGPETADSILCYAFEKPVFVIDAYTKRVLIRHGHIKSEATYNDMQTYMMKHIPQDVSLYNDYHAQLVAVGNHYCKPKPKCEDCPLRDELPKTQK